MHKLLRKRKKTIIHEKIGNKVHSAVWVDGKGGGGVLRPEKD